MMNRQINDLQARKEAIQARLAVLRKELATATDKEQRHAINVEIDGLCREQKQVKEAMALQRSINRELGTLGVGD